jgi:LuxR family maltose regulon positive regulatory protein
VTATLGSYIALAVLQMLQGRLRAAAATFADVERLAPGQEALRVLIGSPAYYFYMGDLLCEWNDLDAADGYLARGMELLAGGMGPDADVILLGYLALARVQQAQGNAEAALATLDAFVRLGRERMFFPLLIEQAVAMRAQFQLAQGDLPAALRWAAASGLSPADEICFPRERAHLALARVRIAAGQAAAVLPLLERLLADAEAKARMHSAIEILTVQALAYDALAERPHARMALERALALAASEGFVRIFVDAGEPMAALLAQSVRDESPVAAYVATLLEAFPRIEDHGLRARPPEQLHAARSPQPAALVEPLSNRELEILHLIADGHSNQAIADTVIIAVSTVKRHINNIYGKLAVQSRTQALVRARELNLL